MVTESVWESWGKPHPEDPCASVCSRMPAIWFLLDWDRIDAGIQLGGPGMRSTAKETPGAAAKCGVFKKKSKN
jgi:hypothetical protein